MELFLRVINVSLETIRIVDGLPKLDVSCECQKACPAIHPLQPS